MSVRSLFAFDDVIKDTLKLVVGNFLGRGGALLLMPIVTRLYAPHAFGEFTVFTSLMSILSVGVSLRYERAILLPSSDDEAVLLAVLSIAFAFLISTILFVFLKVDPQFFFDFSWFHVGISNPALQFLPLSILLSSFFVVINVWGVRQQEYKMLAISKVGQTLTQVVTQIFFGLFIISSSIGLILGQVAGYLLGSVCLLFLATHIRSFRFKRNQIRQLLILAKRYRSFPIYSMPASILNTLAVYLPNILLVNLYSASVVGWFGMATQVIRVPMSILEEAIGRVYLGKAARLKYSKPDEVLRLYLQTMARLLVIGAIPFSILFLFGPVLFKVLLGSQWAMTGHYVSLLSPALFVEFIVISCSQNFTLFERVNLSLLLNVVYVIFISLVFLCGYIFSVSINQMIILISVCIFMSNFILMILNLYVIKSAVADHDESV